MASDLAEEEHILDLLEIEGVYQCDGLVTQVTLRDTEGERTEYCITGTHSATADAFTIEFIGNAEKPEMSCCEEFGIKSKLPNHFSEHVEFAIRGFEITVTTKELPRSGGDAKCKFTAALRLLPRLETEEEEELEQKEERDKFQLAYYNIHNGWYAHSVKLVFTSAGITVKRISFI